ncbi:MAG: hypothetical protein H0U57_07045 [Tatlockia sp.]|nr:hypothetical protein [Tatlockia sp.]
MQQKSELTKLQNEILEIIRGPARQNQDNLKSLVGFNPFNRLKESYNWYEKAMLKMIRAKGIEYNIFGLSSVFFAIRKYQAENTDIGEIIYIIDQFARRLEIVDLSKNTIDEVALICAIVGIKAASDLALWNIDFLDLYNYCINFSTCETLSLYKINELERHHLFVLDYVLGFSETSKMDERIHRVINYLDLKGIQTIEKELQTLKFSGEGLKLGSHIQKAIFIKTHDTTPGFFRKSSKKSKSDNDIAPSEKTMTVFQQEVLESSGKWNAQSK